MRIQHNISALNAFNKYTGNNASLSKNLQKLSSGYRINSAADDAAGLAISEKMRSQIKGLEQAINNSNDGISLVQTAEGAMTEISSMLTRMKELATQSANGTYDTKVDRLNLQEEVNALLTEIDRISKATNFNGINLLDGSLDLTTQVSASLSATLGGGEMKFATDPLAKMGNKAAAITIKADSATTAAGTTADIKVSLAADTSAINITLATKDIDTTHTAAEIQEAVRKAATETINVGTVTDEDELAFLKGIASSFTMESNDITLVADSTDNPLDTPATIQEKGSVLTLQVGDTNADFQKVDVKIKNMSSAGLGIDGLDISNQEEAGKSVDTINEAVNKVSKQRGQLGALQNRLDHTVNNLTATTENITASEAQIRDVDMAKEMTAFTKNNILVQAAQSMLAQANQLPQGVLQLLQ